ncbi:MAG: hypothetical protein AMXMBFR13_14560 [Phycisphaerae bacterium]
MNIMDRRQFIQQALGVTAAGTLRMPLVAGASRACAQGRGNDPVDGRDDARTSVLAGADRPRSAEQRKLIVVIFGGGTRFSESIGDPEHRYIPRLWNELAPRGTLFTHARADDTIVHTNCTAAILTGHIEYEDNDWSRPVDHPTIFEILRRSRRAADTSAWAFVYASILAKTGESRAAGYGREFAANVVEPPTIPRVTADEMTGWMQRAAASGSVSAELEAARRCAEMARTASRIATGGLRSDAARDFLEREYTAWKHGTGTTSHDAFLTDRAIACMRRFAPDVLAVAFGEIDCAHYGSWSRYVEAIRRTDELTWRLWRAAERLDAYRGRTLLLVVPDHGRELDRAGGMGFIHHSDFYTGKDTDEGCRRVWMLAVGAGVKPAVTIDRPVSTRCAAATGLAYLGLQASPGAAPSLWEQVGKCESEKV